MKPTEQLKIEADSAAACRGELSIAVSLRHGGTGGGKLAYELLGPPGAPLLIVAGGISAGRHVLASYDFPEPGWWQSQTVSLDSSRYQILGFDWLGADGAIALPIDPADQVEALRQLLDHLGIARAAGFIGASYGAMVGMHFAALFPHRLDALLAISASDRPHPFASACRALQRQALTLGERNGEREAGVALARALAILTYRTPQEFEERFAARPTIGSDETVRVAAEDYLDAQGRRHAGRMNSLAYRRLSESIDLHWIDPAEVKVPLTLVAVDNDALVPAADIERMAARVPGGILRRISSRFGHDAFLKEEAQVSAIITEFLASLEISQ
jgi:homoserine O-acetyltransferase/O-succinyltransferase